MGLHRRKVELGKSPEQPGNFADPSPPDGGELRGNSWSRDPHGHNRTHAGSLVEDCPQLGVKQDIIGSVI